MRRIPLLPLCLLILLAAVSPGMAAELPLSPQFSAEIRSLGELLDQSGYAEVLERSGPLLARVRAEFPAGSFDEAKILDFMVHAFYRSSRVMEPEALALADQAVAMKETVLGPDHPELANSLMHLGNLRSRRWDLDEALPPYGRAVAILEAAGPGFDDQRAVILSSEGVVYRRLGRNLEALKLYGQALTIQEKVLGPDHPDVASTLNNLAVVLGERGDYARAAELHRRALAIREKHFGPDHEWVGESANNLASQLGYLGLYDEALAVQERAVQIFHDRLGHDHQRYWWAKLNLGIVYLDMGDQQGALPLCREVLVGLQQRYGSDHEETCYAWDALGACHFGLGEFQQALDTYTASLQVAEEAYGKGSYETADTILQQGKCLIALGRLDEAVARLETCLAIQEANLDGENALLCELLNRLAELHLQRGAPALALTYAARSSAISRRDLGAGHPLLAASCLLEGRAQKGLGRLDEALDSALLAEDISRHHLQRTMRVLAEARALDYAGTRVEGLGLALSLLADGQQDAQVARVWDAVIRSRSAVLDEYTARNRHLSGKTDTLATALLDSSLVLRERLANLTLRGPGWEEVPVYRQLLNDAEAGLNDVERQLSLQDTEYRHRQEVQATGFAEVAAALPADCALVAFARCSGADGQDSYKAFALAGPGAEPRFHDLGAAVPIDTAVDAWRDQITFGVKIVDPVQGAPDEVLATRGFLKVPRSAEEQLLSYRAVSDDLRRLVWDPVAADLPQAGRVFLVADGSLHLVNFSSLPAAAGGFLLEGEQLLHILTSEKTLIRAPQPEASRECLLALGNPDYQGQDDGQWAGSPLAGRRFSSLPHTRIEIEQVGAIWADRGGEAVLLLGAQASEEELKRQLPGTRVLHLATHGFFLPAEGAVGGDPLVRAGLVLAGTGASPTPAGSGGDGLLTAAEVSALDLTGVQWAVLSACDTGLGELAVRGEGVFGLRRVFSLAGARTVIMSLWQVEDESSSLWMQALYRAHWRDGLDTAEAVRRASLEMLERRRSAGLSDHPFYWAGFVAAGDWR